MGKENKLKATQLLDKPIGHAALAADWLPVKIFTATANGEVQYVNKQWTDFTGVSLEQARSQGWPTNIHPSDVQRVRASWQLSLETGKPYQAEQRLRRHDGVYRWHLTAAHPVRDDSDSIVQWVGTTTDIHDIRRMVHQKTQLETITRALKQQRSQLVALNHAKDEFISLASHQLRTPATAVKQYLAMLLDGYVGEVTADQRRMIETAYESNERQLNTVNDLLHVAQVDAGKVFLHKEPIDLSQLTASIIKDQQSKFAGKEQTVSYSTEDNVRCKADKLRMRMVLENLIDNASKYTHPRKAIKVLCQKTKNYAEISIADEGVGISSNQMSKLFKKFSRIENPLSTQVGGTGLGLYWANKIVSLHNGKLEVQSTPDVGTVFTVKLPLA